jgi:hypothetical protein
MGAGTMFDLEKAIETWRRRLAGRNKDSHINVDEMEGHLWDTMDALMASDMSEQEAFQKAVRDFGDENELRRECLKANWESVAAKRTVFAPMLLINYLKLAMRQFVPKPSTQ